MRLRARVLSVGAAVAIGVAALTGCRSESGDQYASVPEGKLAPGSATLVKEWAEEESFDPAAFHREYRSLLTQEQVSDFYLTELTRAGWKLRDGHIEADLLAWENGELTLTLSHDMKKGDGSHWDVTVRPKK